MASLVTFLLLSLCWAASGLPMKRSTDFDFSTNNPTPILFDVDSLTSKQKKPRLMNIVDVLSTTSTNPSPTNTQGSSSSSSSSPSTSSSPSSSGSSTSSSPSSSGSSSASSSSLPSMSQSSSSPPSTGSSSSSSMVGNKAPQSNYKMTKNYRNRNLDYPSYGQAYPLPAPFFPPMQVFIIILLLCYWSWSIIMILILFLKAV